jgi:hypothetical protein
MAEHIKGPLWRRVRGIHRDKIMPPLWFVGWSGTVVSVRDACHMGRVTPHCYWTIRWDNGRMDEIAYTHVEAM